MTESLISADALRNWRAALAGKHPPQSELGRLEAGIEQLLARSGAQINLRDYVRLLEGIHPAHSIALAWEVGAGTALGGGFRAVLGCKTLGAALHWACMFFPLLQDDSDMKLTIDGDWAALSYKILDPAIWPRQVDAVYTLALLARLLHAARPEAWPHVRIALEADAPAVAARLESAAQAPVTPGCPANALRFPASFLDAQLALNERYDPDLIARLFRQLTSKERATPLSARARKLIFAEMNEGRVSQSRIAGKLGVSSRTLRRRLADERQPFQTLLDECRMQVAAQELRIRGDASLADMALRLGYTEHSTFTRAFARWFGMAPRDYRRALSTGAAGAAGAAPQPA